MNNMHPTFAIEKERRETRSIAPAIAIFAVFFGIGVYSGHLFAATVSQNGSVHVNAYVSANGADGTPGANGTNGANGADGANGAAGTSTVSVKVKSVVNGKIVTDIDEERQSTDGSGLGVTVSGNKVTWSGNSDTSDNSDAASVTADADSEDGSSSDFLEVNGRSVVSASASGELASASSEASDTNISESADESEGSGGANIFVGFYSHIKIFFSHVASFFHI